MTEQAVDQTDAQTAFANAQKLDRLAKLSKKLEKHPFDGDLWNSYMNECHTRGDPELIREGYEKLVQKFPTSSKHWINYLEFEQKHREFERMESLFNRCLRSVISVDLWIFYLNYIRRIHSLDSLPSSKVDEARATISQAYDFALGNIGFDKDSSVVWTEYLQFIKGGHAKNPYEEQQKMDRLRRIYQQVLLIPVNNIEQLWKDYDSFENNLNKTTAKKFIAERSAAYMTARSALKEMRNLLDPIETLKRNFLPKYPIHWNETDCQRLILYKRYLMWEKSNPLRIDDKNTLAARVMYAYRTALLTLRYYPEIWLEASDYLVQEGKQDEALQLLRNGLEAMPSSLLLSFALADLEEAKKSDFSVISEIFENLIQKLEEEIVQTDAKYDDERDKILASLKNAPKEETQQDNWDGEARERERGKAKEVEKEIADKVEAKRKVDQYQNTSALTLTFIVYMQVSRRQGEKQARQVFGKVRKNSHVRYQAYVYSALMEYHCSKDAGVAGRVFEHSLKSFSSDPEQYGPLSLAYLDFLIGSNNETNARAVFERVITALPGQVAKPVWDKMSSFEFGFGEFAVLKNIEKRRAETIIKDEMDPLERLSISSNRFSFGGIDYIKNQELGLSALRDFVAGVSQVAKTEVKAEKGASVSATPLLSTAAMLLMPPITEVHSKEEKDKKPTNLAPFHPERFSRPDLTKWSSFKPDAVPPPKKPNRVGSPSLSAPSPTLTSATPIPSSSTAPPSPNSIVVPTPLLDLITKLPLPHVYDGPILPVEAVMESIKQLPVPMPSLPISWSPLPPANQPPFSSLSGGPQPSFYPQPPPGGYARDRDVRRDDRQRRQGPGRFGGQPSGGGKRKGSRDEPRGGRGQKRFKG